MTYSLDEVRTQISLNGYAILGQRPLAVLAGDMFVLASELGGEAIAGRSGALIEVLEVRDFVQAHPFSLSRLSGADIQPWHVDGSHLTVPPRLLILGCQSTGGPGAPPTQLLRVTGSGLCLHAACREPFLVKNGRASFYSTIGSKDRPWVRFDPGCMIAQTEEGRGMMSEVASAKVGPSLSLDWALGQILVIDNWMALHRRGAGQSSGRRALLRISLMDKS